MRACLCACAAFAPHVCIHPHCEPSIQPRRAQPHATPSDQSIHSIESHQPIDHWNAGHKYKSAPPSPYIACVVCRRGGGSHDVRPERARDDAPINHHNIVDDPMMCASLVCCLPLAPPLADMARDLNCSSKANTRANRGRSISTDAIDNPNRPIRRLPLCLVATLCVASQQGVDRRARKQGSTQARESDTLPSIMHTPACSAGIDDRLFPKQQLQQTRQPTHSDPHSTTPHNTQAGDAASSRLCRTEAEAGASKRASCLLGLNSTEPYRCVVFVLHAVACPLPPSPTSSTPSP